jgi:positive regulator of sigma E activity
MKKRACIHKIEEKKVHLTIQDEKDCKSCGLCSGNQSITLHRKYFPSDVKKDDIVEIEYNISQTLSAFLIFFLPLIFMIAGFIIFNSIFLLNEGISILGAVAGLVVSVGIIKAVDIKKQEGSRPEIHIISRQSNQ